MRESIQSLGDFTNGEGEPAIFGCEETCHANVVGNECGDDSESTSCSGDVDISDVVSYRKVK